MTHHAVSHQCVCSVKEMIPKIKPILLFGWRRGKVLIFVAEFCKSMMQQMQLHRIIHVNAWEVHRPAPDCFRQRLRVGNRLVEMDGCYMKAVSLPTSEQFGEFRALKARRHHRSDEA